ncbi:MAG: formylglycine-generating enzyme family protein [Candidatus Magnetominusculus sp. LBB02]|nr:formylglycine-generating enzyme family protein [Candidatus Magnetominusculus sp. LBB02]
MKAVIRFAVILSLAAFAACASPVPSHEAGKEHRMSALTDLSANIDSADYRDCSRDCVTNACSKLSMAEPQYQKDCAALNRICLMECRYPMTFVKGGCFQMGDMFGDGDLNEKPVHKVCLSDFYIGKYLVTQRLWLEVMENNPSEFEGSERPVENVSWEDVQQFVIRLSERTGKKYRLPSEAQWEFACRDRGKKIKFAGTSDPGALYNYAWFGYNSANRTHAVGQKRPNELGLYDMSGNVDEWVADIYAVEAYSRLDEKDPIFEETSADRAMGTGRVMRGGSFFLYPQNVRCSSRSYAPPTITGLHYVGFRLGLDAQE